MKLLIDIPEHIYEHAKETTEDSRDEFDAMRAIANGTRQESSSENPNTCGDAISREELIEALNTWDKFGYAPTHELIPLRGSADKDKYVPYIHYDDVIKCIKGMPSVTKQPCDDAISRQAIKQKLQEHHDFYVDAYGGFKNLPLNDKSRVDEITTCIAMVVNELSVTPQQRMGRWIPTGYDGYADGNPVYDWWECSECRWEHTGDEESLTAFCPNCGAKMEVEE